MAFQRRKVGGNRRQGALARLHRAGPGHPRSRRCRPESAGSTKSSSTATVSRSISPTRRCKIFTRRGHDWTHRFKKVAHDAWQIKAGSRRHRRRDRGAGRRRHDRLLGAAERAQGQVDQHRPGRLRSALSERPRSPEAAAVPAQGRTEEDHRPEPTIQFSESFEVDGQEMFAHACKVGLEGVVSKVRDSAIRRDAATTGSRRPARSGRR